MVVVEFMPPKGYNMQGLTLLTSVPKVPAGVAPAEGGSGDVIDLEGVDFAALLAAQIKSGKADAPVIAATADLAADDFALADGKLADVKGEALAVAAPVDPMLASLGLIPLPPAQAVVTQQSSTEQVVSEGQSSDLVLDGISQTISAEGRAQLAVVSGRAPLDQKGVAVQPLGEGAVDPALGQSQVTSALSAREEVAEFAVGGKALPPDPEIKASEARIPLVVEAAQRQPDSLSSSVSVAMAASQPVPPAAAKTVATATVQTPVGSAGWGDALGQKVVWIAGQQQQVAELHLNPPNLGPMEVRLTIANDQVNAIFVSSQPAVRDAIEAAMPRLREMFADSGMTLGNAMVSSDSLPQQQNASQDGHPRGVSPRSEYSLASDATSPDLAHGTLSLRGDGRGMVDLFA